MLTEVHRLDTLRPSALRERVAAPDERPAREALRGQIARLEDELAGLLTSAWAGRGPLVAPAGVNGPAGARVLPLGELEALRDELTERVRAAKRAVAERAVAEERNRRLIEEMQLDPEGHRWLRVTNADIGEAGCKNWHVRPRAGLLGMLMGWWRVIVSSGCP
jgi:hypothetical protein